MKTLEEMMDPAERHDTRGRSAGLDLSAEHLDHLRDRQIGQTTEQAMPRLIINLIRSYLGVEVLSFLIS